MIVFMKSYDNDDYDDHTDYYDYDHNNHERLFSSEESLHSWSNTGSCPSYKVPPTLISILTAGSWL